MVFSLDQVYFLDDFCKLSKTPSDGTLLGRTSRRFLWCWSLLLFFTSLEVFTFSGYFSLPSALHPDFSGPWRFPPALILLRVSFGCFTFAGLFRHIFTASATVLSGHFFVPCTPSSHFGTFYDSDVGRSIPSRILLGACPHRVVPSGWCMALNYSYCSYKTINLSIAPVSHEVKS